MDFTFENVDKIVDQIRAGGVIDLSKISFIDPWCTVQLCMMLAESRLPAQRIVMPTNTDVLTYLKRMHFSDILKEYGYEDERKILDDIQISELPNPHVQEIVHCTYRDDFNAKLEYFKKMFVNFGLNLDDSARATTLVAELGNNVFDHNLGNWPTQVVGCFIAGQSWPKLNKISISVGDSGVGFLNSLKPAFPDLKDSLSAIKKGLAGNTGRIGEIRGNGLKLIQEWTIESFAGEVAIQSGDGLVRVSSKGNIGVNTYNVMGTIAQFVLYYK